MELDSPPAADFTGDWQRYNGSRGGPPADPATLPPPAGKLLLKAQYKGPYDVKRAKERESDEKGEPIAGSAHPNRPHASGTNRRAEQ